MNTSQIEVELRKAWAAAEQSGQICVVVQARDLHLRLAPITRSTNRMPMICNVMWRLHISGLDRVVYAPPSRQGATLTIAYCLPRPGSQISSNGRNPLLVRARALLAQSPFAESAPDIQGAFVAGVQVGWSVSQDANPADTDPVPLPAIAAPTDPSRKPLRYRGLQELLAQVEVEDDEVPLSFEKIEKSIGSDLPDSAKKYRPWWGNSADSHTQARSWLEAGWRVAKVDLDHQEVIFRRQKQ